LKEVNTGGGDSVPRETMRKHNKGLRSSPIRGPFKTHLTTPPVKPNQLTQQANKSQVSPSIVDCRWIVGFGFGFGSLSMQLAANSWNTFTHF